MDCDQGKRLGSVFSTIWINPTKTTDLDNDPPYISNGNIDLLQGAGREGKRAVESLRYVDFTKWLLAVIFDLSCYQLAFLEGA